MLFKNAHFIPHSNWGNVSNIDKAVCSTKSCGSLAYKPPCNYICRTWQFALDSGAVENNQIRRFVRTLEIPFVLPEFHPC